MNLETIYPAVPGLPVITGASDLGAYIGYFFGLGIMAAGILAGIFIVWGGINIIMAAGNPSRHKDGVEIIKGAVLGLVLLLASFMILQTINPKFITPDLTPLPPGEGIFYYNGTDRLAAPMSLANAANIPAGYEQILYACTTGQPLIIWKYPKKNFQGNDANFSGVAISEIICGKVESIAGYGSYKLAFKNPGIYFYFNESCTGYMSDNVSIGGDIPWPFKNRALSYKIINNTANNIRYGVILHAAKNVLSCSQILKICHDDPSLKGCENMGYDSPNCIYDPAGPYYSSQPAFIYDLTKEEGCFNTSKIPALFPDELTFFTVSAGSTMFAWNYDLPYSSGSGVNFYSEPWGKFQSSRAGMFQLKNSVIETFWATDSRTRSAPCPENDNACEIEKRVIGMEFTYYSGSRPPNYKSIARSFLQHPGSIYLDGGKYLIGLCGPDLYSSSTPESGDKFKNIFLCQIITSDLFNYNFLRLRNAYNSRLDYIYVIPIK